MGLNIVDADIKDLKQSRSRGRVRSAETKALVEAIDSLTPGKAKAISLAPGQDAAKIRARERAYAAAASIRFDGVFYRRDIAALDAS